MEKLKRLLAIFLSFFKIGLLTFGGGYAMIALIEREFVTRKKWVEEEEFLNIIAIAESTPGPLAINAATYIGYKTGKISGAVTATVAVSLPSFVIIYIISLFFDKFLEFEYVAYAFKGIQTGIAFMILSAGVKMLIKMKKDAFNIIIFLAVLACMICFTLFSVDFSAVFYLLLSGLAGLTVYLIRYIKDRGKDK